MKKIVSIALCVLLLLCCTLPVQAASDVPEEVMESAKSVVRILSEGYSSSATGSGFVIKNEPEQLLIATNYHVVENNPYSISVWVGEEEMVDAEILIPAPEKDLCILSITENLDLNPLPLSDEEARQGEAVFAVGFPGAADNFSDTAVHTSEEATITDGIISAIRTLTMDDYGDPVKLLQINAAINSGNSGGPLFNAQGQVIGVNTLGITSAQGVFAAIDISELRALLEENDIVLPVIEEPEAVPETEPEAPSEPVPQEQPKSVIPGIVTGVVIAAALAAGVLIFFKVRKKQQVMTLRDFMASYPQGLGVHGAVALLLPAAIQLRDLHNNGKLHLQVSPDNILLSPKGAALKEPSGQEADRFAVGFAAPEIYKGAGYGITSDIYSFAALLYYGATGSVPSNSLQQDQLELDLALLKSLEPAFAEVIQKSMAFTAQDRTQSVQELIYQISSFNTQPFQMPAQTWNSGAGTAKVPDKKLLIAAAAAVLVLIAAAALIPGMVKKSSAYQDAVALLEAGQYEEAAAAFTQLEGYKDSPEMVSESRYRSAAQLLEEGQYEDAIAVFSELNGYSDSAEKIRYAENERDYEAALLLLEEENYEEARTAFEALGDYRDAADYLGRFEEKYVELTQVGELDGLKEYELTYEYENGLLMKEICEYTPDADSRFYGYNMTISDGEDTAFFTSVFTRNEDGTAKKLNIFNDSKTLLQTRIYSYNADGMRIKESYDYKSNSSSKDATYVYDYDENGNKISRMWYQNLTGSGTPYQREYYEYDEHDNLVRQYYKYNWYFYSSSSSGEYLYRNEYDEKGQIIRHISTKTNAYSYEYEYDEDGNMTVKRQIQNDKYGGYESGTVTTEYLYEYDEFGNLVKQTNNYLSSGSVRIITHTYGNVLVFE